MGNCVARREKSYPSAPSPALPAAGVFGDPVLAAVRLQRWNEARKSSRCHSQGSELQHYEAGKYLKDQFIFEDILDEDLLVLSHTTWAIYIL